MSEQSDWLDEATCDVVVSAHHAILFIHAEWSAPSATALKAFEDWTKEFATWSDMPTVSFLKIKVTGEVNEQPVLQRWLGSQKLEMLTRTGNGEVLWIEHGKVVEGLLYTYPVTHEQLTEITARLWARRYSR